MGLRPFRSPALQPGPCHGCRGTCKDDLPLPVSPTTRAELLGTGVQVAHLKPFWSLGSWLPNKVVWGSGGRVGVKWASPWKQAGALCLLLAFQNHSPES